VETIGMVEVRYTGRTGAADGGTMDSRVSWDEYFMNIARVVATRATCDRKHVGAVVVRDKTILSTGYNGSIRGLPHCSEAGHMMEEGHCVRTVHAEANAIIQAAKNGVSIDGCSVYTTASPCWPCFKLIANSGARRIVFGEFYRDNRIFEYAQQIGIELVSLEVPSRPDLQPDDTGAPRPVAGTGAPRGGAS
jgi:dCMP deaminase